MPTHATTPDATFLVFTLDRAAQTDLLLRSMASHIKLPYEVHLYLGASNADYTAGYERLLAEHPGVIVHDEGDADVDTVLRSVLAESSTTLFSILADDDLIIRDVRAEDAPLRKLLTDPAVHCASLRLAPQKTWSQPIGRAIPVPRIEDGIVDLGPRRSWPVRRVRRLLRMARILTPARTVLHGCWRVPFSFDGNLYLRERLRAFLDRLPRFEHVTSIEPLMCKQRHLWDGPLHAAIYDEERLVNLVMNNVDTQGVRYPHPGHSLPEMNQRYLAGELLDMQPYEGGTFNACHLEVEPLYVGA